ncbi:unnamed protein product [Rotaria sordida]|uniref:Uncharacterized protein n=1 Tax=Rotaria sordida TaxID=392033 RepID=A0A815FSE9_9BILA|nr:unnamed protein product [Rotaria sordida]CAF1330008.1 unnamed protein product [Rotaria sordida]
MFRLTVNNKSSPNSVDIPLQQFCNCSLCPDCGFDTTYPSKLQSLISPTDFHQSIKNINNYFPKSHVLGILALIHGFTELKSSKNVPGEPALAMIGVGTVCILIGVTCCCLCRYCCRQQGKSVQS